MISPLVIVAGAGPGVGAAIARRFVREGFRVALIARNPANLNLLAAPILAAGGTASTYACDLSDHDNVRDVMLRIVQEQGAPQVLVWNAAIWSEASVLSMDPSDFDRQLRLGLTCAVTAIQAAEPSMTTLGAGTILMTGGGLALAPQHGGAVPALTAVKSALRGFVHASAAAFAKRGVRLGMVTIAGQVAPGGAFDPDRIAEAFWALHASPQAPIEQVFDGN